MNLLKDLFPKDKLILSFITVLLLASLFQNYINFQPFHIQLYQFSVGLVQCIAIVFIIAMSIVHFRKTKIKLFYYLTLGFSVSAVNIIYGAILNLLVSFGIFFAWASLLAILLSVITPLIISYSLATFSLPTN
ncbi:MAG: hypothetical protein ABFD04_02515 [Syntrophomonas sp.]